MGLEDVLPPATFKMKAEEGKGAAVIIAGSDSDKEHVAKISNYLLRYHVPHTIRIASAHKQPQKLLDIIEHYDAIDAPIAFIAVAGGTDALSGTLSYHMLHPVISCPPDAPNQSVLNNPPGSSNATIYNAKNAARFVAQLYAHSNPDIHTALLNEIGKKEASLKKADNKYQQVVE